MIGTLLHIGWLNLKRDKVALLLTFVLPMVFFTVFGFIYSGMSSGGGMRPIRVVVVDEDHSEAGRRLIDALKSESGLRVSTEQTIEQDGVEAKPPWTREAATAQVRDGEAPLVVVIPNGFGETFGSFAGDAVPVELLFDQANAVAPQMVTGLLQKAAMTTAPDLMITRGLEMFEQFGGPMTPKQRESMDFFLPRIRELTQGSENSTGSEAPAAAANDGAGFTGLVQVKSVNVMSEGKQKTVSLIAHSAAGIGVMFLLFSMAGAGGSLLEEEESGALERLLISNVGMTRLLLGKWLFIAIMGVLQVTLMFAWGALIFGIELFEPRTLAGFAVMTLVTAAAAAAFGMMLAAACRTRAQLGGLSTIVILLMSALGGSMVPRMFLRESPVMDKAGLATFNAWAIDGYQKIFWYQGQADTIAETIIRILPQVAVLAAMAVAFLVVARLLARRWEAV